MRLLLAASLFFAGAAFPQKVLINIGTAAPEGSPWHRILEQTRQDWARLSGGNLTLRIYPSGVQGDEVEMTRKVRIGQLQAVGLSGVGLAHLEPSVAALAIPMLLDNYDEFDYVREKLAPRLEALMEKKGFIVLQWSDVGWVRFFSKTPAKTPDDFRKLKIFTSAGDPEGERLYKEFGFQVVPLSVTDMLPALRTNQIQAFDVPPLFAMLDQSFGVAKNMVDVRWVALSGATVLSKRTWDAIPEKQRAEMLAASRAASQKVRGEVRKMGEDAIGAMQKRGLSVYVPDAAALTAWRSAGEAAYPKLRGRLIPADLFDEAVRLRDEYRRSGASKGGK